MIIDDTSSLSEGLSGRREHSIEFIPMIGLLTFEERRWSLQF